ncbi:SGNH/GDSL hydrolase family protein [Muricauda sp. ANG21]|uniref:SGNH/GDSL hydrolase family protein n=1 Tax=Allomuricauda sp. ANG21 TaxID=3042468 RepID=UPI0034523E1B
MSLSLYKVIVTLLVFNVCLAQVEKKQVNEKMEGVIWHDPMEQPFQLIGFEWMEKDHVFRRLPLLPERKIPQAVDDLADQTAGGQLRFQTNSNRIFLQVELSNYSNMYHMPPTGQSGFDLYIEEKGIPRYIQTSKFAHDATEYITSFAVGDNHELQTFRINFPLYNGIEFLAIGIEDGTVVRKAEPLKHKGKVVVYGTSITQGGCVSRPGMVYSNILSRKLGVEFVNLGFSGNGKGEPEIAHIINEISDLRLVVLDYEANANMTIRETIGPFVDILRMQKPNLPILIVSKIRVAYAVDGSEAFERLLDNRDYLEGMVLDRKKSGDDNIYFVDGSIILGEDYSECTVDRIHPTDLGSYRIAKALSGVIQNILEK